MPSIEASPLPALLLDAEGRVRAWNAACARLLGAAVDLAGRPGAQLFGPVEGPSFEALLARVQQGETIERVALRTVCGAGAGRYLLGGLSPVTDPARSGRPAVLLSGVDITERVQSERALWEAKEATEKALQLKQAIVHNLSHEIRTPLTSILGFAELLYEEVPETQREFVHLIRSSSKRLMSTLVSVLELARLESGDVRLEAEAFDLGAEVAESARLFMPLAQKKGLRLVVEAPAEPVLVRLDRIAVNRILSNLLSNAVKFTPDGSVRVALTSEGDDVVLRVVDTGLGMSEAFLPYLFQEFKQETIGRGRLHEGAGLGLAITRRLVEQMGGTIEATSRKGHGSTFTVRLPRHLAA